MASCFVHREAFFIDLKCQIKRGDIHIPNSKKGLIGARIAQVEMGNASDSTTTPTVYPPYFPNWNSGIAHIIGKEHKKLKGILLCIMWYRITMLTTLYLCFWSTILIPGYD